MLNIMPPPAGRQPGDPGVPDFGLIGTILDELHCDELIERLEDYRWTGRPGYAPEVMWRATLVRYLLRLRYTRDLIAQLNASRLLRRVCGLRETVPHEGTFSRFYARLAEHQDLVDAAIAQLAERVGAEIERLRGEGALPDDAPEPGRMVSIDSSDVAAWGNGKGKTKADAEAKWGHRTAKLAVDGKELFYGYKLHAICDAYYGTPLSWEVLPANKNESPRLPVLMDQLAANHPTLKVRYAIADRGYDALSNYEHLDNSRIFAVIHMRDTDKNGLYTVKGQPRCMSGKPMQYVRSERGKGHLFRCPEGGAANSKATSPGWDRTATTSTTRAGTATCSGAWAACRERASDGSGCTNAGRLWRGCSAASSGQGCSIATATWVSRKSGCTSGCRSSPTPRPCWGGCSKTTTPVCAR